MDTQERFDNNVTARKGWKTRYRNLIGKGYFVVLKCVATGKYYTAREIDEEYKMTPNTSSYLSVYCHAKHLGGCYQISELPGNLQEYDNYEDAKSALNDPEEGFETE